MCNAGIFQVFLKMLVLEGQSLLAMLNRHQFQSGITKL
jgi:hypothetical protein